MPPFRTSSTCSPPPEVPRHSLEVFLFTIFDLKTALVTGASGAIGAAIAQALGSAGFRVAVHYRSGLNPRPG
jgi:NADPH:quinone reductase-like Zn-dependent oxidoreductase